MATRVYVRWARRVFASAADWPGWAVQERRAACNGGAGGQRHRDYAAVQKPRGVAFSPGAGFTVVERLPGDATTEFGAPGKIANAELKRLTKKEAGRLSALVAASWTIFDRVVETAPASLRKGPRGGGRDRDAIVEARAWR